MGTRVPENGLSIWTGSNKQPAQRLEARQTTLQSHSRTQKSREGFLVAFFVYRLQTFSQRLIVYTKILQRIIVVKIMIVISITKHFYKD